MSKPAVFIASSSKSLDLARAIKDNLDRDADVTVWDEGSIAVGNYTLDALLQRTAEFDFGVFVLSPNDLITKRDRQLPVARDNVLFEFGLFVSELGRDRAFLVYPRDVPDFRLPSDLIGLNGAEYESDRLQAGDPNRTRAVLGFASNQIRARLQQGPVTGTLTPDLILLLRYLAANSQWTLPDSFGKGLAIGAGTPEDVTGDQLTGWNRAVRYALLYLSHLGLAQRRVDTSVTYTISPRGKRLLDSPVVQKQFADSFRRELRPLSGRD
jgi:hypothetical protein